MRTLAKLATLVVAALPAAALAQDRATQFVAVTGPTQEHVPGGALLVGAYGLVWLILFGVVLRTAMVQARTAKDLERLERALDAKAPKNDAPVTAKEAAASAKEAAVPAKEAAEEKAT